MAVRNEQLSQDYVRRADARLKALDVLFDAASWADVVREAQEVVELSLKALLRRVGVDPPRLHDVGDVLLAERERLPEGVRPHLEQLARISRTLRRDRELAFYGAEDFTPSDFYKREDAESARADARTVVGVVRSHIS